MIYMQTRSPKPKAEKGATSASTTKGTSSNTEKTEQPQLPVKALDYRSPESVNDMESADGSSSEQICRICYGGESSERLARPCSCRGTIAAVHRTCLEHWFRQGASSFCELCRHHYLVTRRYEFSWARSILGWLMSGSGCALTADVLQAFAMKIVQGRALASVLYDRVAHEAVRCGGGAAVAADVFSGTLILILYGMCNYLSGIWFRQRLDEHVTSFQSWRDRTYHVHVTLDENNTGLDPRRHITPAAESTSQDK